MRRKTNALREKLGRGEAAAGVVSRLASPAIVEMVGLAGYDFVWIDLEHAGTGFETLEHLCRAADSVGLEVIVRVPDKSPSNILRALEAGPGTINVPFVETAEEAADIVAAARFAPVGRRGYCTTSRGTGYGFGGTAKDVFAAVNDRTMLMVQIETARGVANADAIAQVPGIDILFVGVADLSQSLSVPGEFGHPDVLKGAERVLAAAKAHGKFASAQVGAVQDARWWQERNVQLFVIAADVTLFGGALKSRREEFTVFRAQAVA